MFGGDDKRVANPFVVGIHSQNPRHQSTIRPVSTIRLGERTVEPEFDFGHGMLRYALGQQSDPECSGCVGTGGTDHPRSDDLENTHFFHVAEPLLLYD